MGGEQLNFIYAINYNGFSKKQRLVLDKIGLTSFKLLPNFYVEFDKRYFRGNKKHRELFKQIINIFVSTLMSECKYFDFNTFRDTFLISRFKLNLKGGKKNKESHVELIIFNEDCEDVNFFFSLQDFEYATHELLHLVSRCGFVYSFIKLGFPKGFGYGLNEGTTALLDRKYFKKESIIYNIEEYIVKLIDKILGNDIVEESYFKYDANILVNELKKYMDINEIYKFIGYLDKISEFGDVFLNNPTLLTQKVPETQQCLYSIYRFLLELFEKKYNMLDGEERQAYISKFSSEEFNVRSEVSRNDGPPLASIRSIDFDNKEDAERYEHIKELLNEKEKTR